ncbi:hypothetical protein E1B28_008124 [Marasmius oreades]|uniref:DUF6533 domain-containing protein n=1 Tax=Marasmius oreades TaxID=181124 RepID=A0A9P7RZ91_9AGAR|nr:uncharacterized protein E1B28_008124 [Marasmius oreades]KAG7091723.1 hypothetical protein E1B28_008124 [Marasmius oreades]
MPDSHVFLSGPSPIPFTNPDGVLSTLNNFAAVKYTNLAFLVVLVYDHALTLHVEVDRIWKLPWKLPKLVFLFVRYLAPPMLW